MGWSSSSRPAGRRTLLPRPISASVGLVPPPGGTGVPVASLILCVGGETGLRTDLAENVLSLPARLINALAVLAVTG